MNLTNYQIQSLFDCQNEQWVGWEYYNDEEVRQLINDGLIVEAWIGQMNGRPIPHWKVSDKGAVSLREYAKQAA